ncbi:MAG: hypothetical protein WC239_10685 [Sphaerochaetaceae bacterium]
MIMESIQRWINRESRGLKYGELSITFKFHDGKLVYIEKHKSEKDKITDTEPGKNLSMSSMKGDVETHKSGAIERYTSYG